VSAPVRRAGVALALVLAGCSGSKTETNNPAATEALVVSVEPPVPSDSAPLATTSASVRGTTEPALPLPTDAVCELSAQSWTKVPAFRLKVDGPSFASVRRLDNGRVLVRREPAKAGIVMRGDVGPVELTGVGVVEELTVFSNKDLLLGGLILPFGSTSLRFVNADVGVVVVGLPQAPIELTSLSVPLQAESICSAVGLSWGKVRPRDSLGKAIDTAALVGETIPLATTDGGEPVAKLVPTTADGSRDVDVLEKGKTATRIAWALKDGIVTGWVPKAALKPAKPSVGQGFGTGTGSVPLRRKPPRESRSCERDLPLGVTLDKSSAFVGRIKSKATLDLYEDDGERVTLQVRDADIRLAEGARLFVEREAIKACPVVPPEPAK
jgi:hypothetical protein